MFLTNAERRLLEDIRNLDGIVSTFSAWELQMVQRLRNGGFILRRDDGAYGVTAAGLVVLNGHQS